MLIFNVEKIVGEVKRGTTNLIVRGEVAKLKDGIGFIDDEGKPHELLQVLVVQSFGTNQKENELQATIRVKGRVDTKRIYV